MMKLNQQEHAIRGEVTVLDGGMGHELKLRGISDGTFVTVSLQMKIFCKHQRSKPFTMTILPLVVM